jgi:hypothetical protein
MRLSKNSQGWWIIIYKATKMEDDSGEREDTFDKNNTEDTSFLMAEEPFTLEFLRGQILLQNVPSKYTSK